METNQPPVLEPGPLISLPTAVNAKKKDLKVVEEFEKGDFKVTVYSYKVTNYGYTLSPLEAAGC